MKWWKLRQARKESYVDIPQWEADYKLGALPEHHWFWEYLEVGKYTGSPFVAFSFISNLLCPENDSFSLSDSRRKITKNKILIVNREVRPSYAVLFFSSSIWLCHDVRRRLPTRPTLFTA